MKWCLIAFVIVYLATDVLAIPLTDQALKSTSLPKAKRQALRKIIAPSSRPKAKRQALPKIIAPSSRLSITYYLNSCPNLEGIIHQRVNAWIKRDYTMAASIIRLHFHDCAVRGCDASILLNYPGSERRAATSKTLRGFDLINDVKAEVERKCPRTVSCADILTAAARDATLIAGGPFWEVPFGRKDGRVSLAREAEMIPQGHENVTTLLDFFQTLGLNIIDLVALSGAHTIGRSTCNSFQQRLYNYNRTGKPDPSINTRYLFSLRRQCRRDTNYVNLDATTPRTFDIAYYQNLQKKMGLLTTDQLLYSDQRTAPIVATLATQPDLFSSQFASSMVNVGNVQEHTRKNPGEIRLNCNYVNP